MRLPCLVLLALLTGLISGSPALAQQTSRELLRGAMEQRGFYSGVEYLGREYTPVESTGRDAGLATSEGLARSDDAGTFMAVLRNTTDRPYCIRLHSIFSPADTVTARMQGNVLVEPYQHSVLLVASTTYTERSTFSIAFWPPDMSRERACSDVAPEGLDDWANAPLTGHFRGSRIW